MSEPAATNRPSQLVPEQPEWLRVTLSSVGDAIITTDVQGRVTFLNPVAERLTGWTATDAVGAPLEAVFKIVNEDSGQDVENPASRVLREGLIVRANGSARGSRFSTRIVISVDTRA